MARRHGILQADAVVDSLTTDSAAWKTLLQLGAAANHAIALTEMGIFFQGTTNTHAPIAVQLVRQTTAGTMTARTPKKADDSVGDTLDTSGQIDATVEPTTGTEVLRSFLVHPQTGLIAPIGDIPPVIVGAGDYVGLRVYSGNDIGVSCHLAFEE